MTVRVLVVADEAIAAEAHRTYVDRVDGFEVVGVARTFQEAVRLLDAVAVDLVLLDMHLPDGHGLDLLRQLRAVGRPIDVIPVTSARDVEVVRAAATAGVVGYVIKPFTFAMLRAKLDQFLEYRSSLDGDTVDQAALDAAFSRLRSAPGPGHLPKGLSAETLDAVRAAIAAASEPRSAAEIGELVGASRVTARRYLEHLADTGQAARSTRYGGAGRPVVEYRAR